MQTEQMIPHRRGGIQIGTYGHLAIFFWLLAMVMVLPQKYMLMTAAVCLSVVAGIYPAAFKRLFNPRMILFGLLVVLPPIFMLGEADRILLWFPYSSEGLTTGLHVGLRFVVILLAVYGFTRSVDIPSVAGTLERFGLQGLGFSLGVALNLLPSLKDAATKSWYSLKMRGGVRKQWFRGIQLYLVVVITNALRQAEDIALAAEARAFSPDKSRPMAVSYGKADWFIYLACVSTFIFAVVWN